MSDCGHLPLGCMASSRLLSVRIVNQTEDLIKTIVFARMPAGMPVVEPFSKILSSERFKIAQLTFKVTQSRRRSHISMGKVRCPSAPCNCAPYCICKTQRVIGRKSRTLYALLIVFVNGPNCFKRGRIIRESIADAQVYLEFVTKERQRYFWLNTAQNS